jgi:hypothetical protein
MYCHVFQWLRRRFKLVNRFIGSSLVITTISSYTLKSTVIIAHVTLHTRSSNSSSGHTAVPLELRNSRILSYPLGMDHAQKTQFYCYVAQTTQETSHVIAISPVHWGADCCLATSYKHSSYCCVRVSQGVYRAVAWQCVDMSQYIHLFIHSSTALQPFVDPWPLLQFRNLFYADGRTPWTSDQPVASRYLHTGQHEYRINAHTDSHAFSGNRIDDSSVRASEDSSCLRPRGHCDWCIYIYIFFSSWQHVV